MEQKNKQCTKGTEMECLKCQTKFDSWLSDSEFDSGMEGEIKKNFHYHCPACRKLEQEC